MDKNGQIALEYLLIFFVLIIIMSIISLPLLTDSIETSNDLSKTVKVKSFLIEMEKNIKIIYSLDLDSKRCFSIYVPCDLVLYYSNDYDRHYVYTTVTLSDNSKKSVRIEVPCNVCFNSNYNHYYSSLKNRWYYNTEVSWIVSSNGERSVNINFK